MNPAPGTSWPDLHYVDTEQVELDVHAIIARGTRLRRRRLISKVAVAAVVVGIGPAVFVDLSNSVPAVHRSAAAGSPDHGRHAGLRVPASFGEENGPMETTVTPAPVAGAAGEGTSDEKTSKGPGTSAAAGDLMLSLARADVRHATTLPSTYGGLLAVAGARGGSGLWFTAASAHLTLFHLSMTGALVSWSMSTPASRVRASGGVGLAVTSAGVAWVGVGTTLLSFDTKSSRLRTWPVPTTPNATRADSGATSPAKPARPDSPDSVAVSPDGHVAVLNVLSRSVQVLDPREGTFQQIRLPSAADQPLAVGYALNGTLGIGYEHRGKARAGSVLLVRPNGAERSVPVPQPTAVSSYGASALLVGATKLDLVSARGRPRSLELPANSADFASVTMPPALLPSNRLAIAMVAAILTFPATTASDAITTGQSTLWVTAPPRCQPDRDCPAGYRMLASDTDGNVWVVPNADPRTVELLSLR